VLSANLPNRNSYSSSYSVSEVEGVFLVVFLVLMRRLIAGGILKRSALSISIRSSLERVDRWLISFWEPCLACFHGVLIVLLLDEKVFA
jgi:hypothetical protein